MWMIRGPEKKRCGSFHFDAILHFNTMHFQFFSITVIRKKIDARLYLLDDDLNHLCKANTFIFNYFTVTLFIFFAQRIFLSNDFIYLDKRIYDHR